MLADFWAGYLEVARTSMRRLLHSAYDVPKTIVTRHRLLRVVVLCPPHCYARIDEETLTVFTDDEIARSAGLVTRGSRAMLHR